MLFTDTYHTITKPSEGEFKDRGSRFIGYAFPVQSEEEVKQHLAAVKKEHFSAGHHCYAFVLGFDQSIQKSNDDREPANTAGKPILRTILSQQLTNTLVIVVRYFGGKLLGVPGLINAYGEGCKQALLHAETVEKIITERHEVSMDFEHENEAFRIAKQFNLKVLDQRYEDQLRMVFEIRKSLADQVLKALKDKRLFTVKFISQQ